MVAYSLLFSSEVIAVNLVRKLFEFFPKSVAIIPCVEDI